MNPYIWCAVGSAIGWLAFQVFISTEGRIVMLENMGVGVFGAFLGGDFVAAQLRGGVVNDKDFSMGSLGLAVGGAVILLVLLRIMRGTVGRLKASKSPSSKRY